MPRGMQEPEALTDDERREIFADLWRRSRALEWGYNLRWDAPPTPRLYCEESSLGKPMVCKENA